MPTRRREAQVAQLVEQRTENPRVGGSIPPLGTILPKKIIKSYRYNSLFKAYNLIMVYFLVAADFESIKAISPS